MEPLVTVMIIMVVAVVLINGIYWVSRFATIMSKTTENAAAPTQTARAKVIDKTMDYDNLDVASAGGGYYSGLCHYGTFETENGQILKLTMGRSDYGGLQPGDTGLLHWSGTKLELFENDRKKAG